MKDYQEDVLYVPLCEDPRVRDGKYGPLLGGDLFLQGLCKQKGLHALGGEHCLTVDLRPENFQTID